VASRLQLEKTLNDFDNYKLDYLCYSFFKASQLDINNLLPLGPVRMELFHAFDLTTKNIALIGKLSPGYYTFSLVSLVSVKYFREVLSAENKKFKVFSRKLSSFITRLFHYTSYRAVFKKIKYALSPFDARL
jgi:hypothetical protein